MSSDKIELNWQLVCRICLQSSNADMKCIFGDPSATNQVDDVLAKLIKCGGVPVEIMDGMPDRICNQCLINLNIAFTFRNTCQHSYYHLLKIVKSRQIPEIVKIEEEFVIDSIKEETIYVETSFSPEPDNERQEILENDCTVKDTFKNGNIQQTTEDTQNLNTVKVKTSAKGSNKSVRKPNTKSEQKKETRGRKPNPVTKFICHICGNMYQLQSRLSQHIKWHSEEKKHECEICGKKFAAAAQLPRHMNTHTGNRPYKCNFCPSSFGDSSTRNKHERIHTNERPFKCLECGKSFAYTNVLKVHMAIHTGERPYSCSVCHKRFSQRHHQQSHERTHTNFHKKVKI